jgi:hypothetical protein
MIFCDNFEISVLKILKQFSADVFKSQIGYSVHHFFVCFFFKPGRAHGSMNVEESIIVQAMEKGTPWAFTLFFQNHLKLITSLTHTRTG